MLLEDIITNKRNIASLVPKPMILYYKYSKYNMLRSYLVASISFEMEPMGIVAFTRGVIGQIGLIFFWCRPVVNRIKSLIDCLRHPRPPPARPVSADTIFKAMQHRFES